MIEPIAIIGKYRQNQTKTIIPSSTAPTSRSHYIDSPSKRGCICWFFLVPAPLCGHHNRSEYAGFRPPQNYLARWVILLAAVAFCCQSCHASILKSWVMLDVEAIRYIQNHTRSEIGRGESEREREREMVREGPRGRGSEEGQVPPLCQGDIDTLLPAPVV